MVFTLQRYQQGRGRQLAFFGLQQLAPLVVAAAALDMKTGYGLQAAVVAASTGGALGGGIVGTASDASLDPGTGQYAWGAVCTDGSGQRATFRTGTSGTPGGDQSNKDTTDALDLEPVVATAEIAGHSWAGKTVVILTDNLPNAYRINNYRVGRGEPARALLQRLCELSDAHNFCFIAFWTPRGANQLCDGLSKCRTVEAARKYAAAEGIPFTPA
jgi:hypothetical protein